MTRRTSRRRNRISQGDPLAIVGWVFADLLLGVALVFLGTQPGDPSAGRAAPTTTTTTTTTVPPSTTTTSTTIAKVPPGVSGSYRCIRVPTDPARLANGGPEGDQYAQQLAAELDQALRANGLAGRKAGIVLAFGTASSSGVGKQYAQLYIERVLPKVPATFGTSAARPFWGAGNDTGSIELNIYPLVGPGQPALGPSNEC